MMNPMLSRLASTACAGMLAASVAMAQHTTPTPPTPPNAPRPHMEMRIEHMLGGGTYLGVVPADVTSEKAQALGMKEPGGVLLDKVLDDGPAKGAGLQENDVIV